jgi:hypothetical protein|nr:MAG TPA: Minor capsid protein [Caudoviricetes sp.]
MMRVTSQVKINSSRIKQLTQAAVTSLEQTAEALHTEVVQAQVVPFRTGALQNESMFLDRSEAINGKVSLVHSTPYARRVYFHPEYHFKKDENPNAKGKWFEDWMSGGRYENFAPDTFKEIYRRNAGL